jgi:HTH-type transcriptional regulator / antitoxin HipB
MNDQRQVIDDVETLGRLIRDARKAQGLTQQEFADVAGVGVRFLSEVERGKETAEVGLVFKVLAMAGFDLHVEHRSHGSPFAHLIDDPQGSPWQ